MKEAELRKLRREDLLLILIEQQRQIDTLTEALKEREAELEKRRVAIDNAGTLAEAAFRMNDVYAAAQKAADTYTDEMHARADKILETARRLSGELLIEASDDFNKAKAMLEDARRQAEEILAEARREAAKINPPKNRSGDETGGGEPPKRRGLLGRRRE